MARQTDAASNAALNPIQLPDGSVVAWADAFPRKAEMWSKPCTCETCERKAA